MTSRGNPFGNTDHYKVTKDGHGFKFIKRLIYYIHPAISFLLWTFRENPFEENTDLPVTNDGKDGVIFNGIPDWVYEEDVLRTNNAIHGSPNAGKIAYARFDDSHVPEFQYPVYGDPFDVSKNKYPEYK